MNYPRCWSYLSWTLLTVVIIAAALNVETMQISMNSMENSLRSKDVILVFRLPRWRSPPVDRALLHRRQIIIFRHSIGASKLLIKRIVAIGGDKVRISDGTLFVNQIRQREPYLARGTGGQPRVDPRSFGEIVVSSGGFFVLGDNRPESVDSRQFGPVPVQDVFGVVVAVFHAGMGLAGIEAVL
jgi:signal peptidase I